VEEWPCRVPWRGAMTTELQIKRKINDLEIDIRLKPQGPLTSTMQEKIDRFRFDVVQILDALAR
jgi:hypothetical protein